MIWPTLTIVSCALAGLGCALFLLNLLVYRRLPRSDSQAPAPPGEPLSVLIPARNEEGNLSETLKAVLASRGAEFEVIVLDDHSTDRTAELVKGFCATDPRIRLQAAPALPGGWCGKPHACQVLAGLARHPLLVFLDADVRLAPDALSRMACFMKHTPAALASGVPHQRLGTFSERLLIPLIHFVLLAYLPMLWGRRSLRPAFAAGCGQLFIARAPAYRAAGGHAAIRATLHDGLKLPRAFRLAGFQTDLFDATDIASCRMYHADIEVWSGLQKNATEGLGAPAAIVPMTLLLLGGQVLPFALLAASPWLAADVLPWILAGVALSFAPRLIGAFLFRQPVFSSLLHPLGVACLVALQWSALTRQLRGRPAEWKGRSYTMATSPTPQPDPSFKTTG